MLVTHFIHSAGSVLTVCMLQMKQAPWEAPEDDDLLPLHECLLTEKVQALGEFIVPRERDTKLQAAGFFLLFLLGSGLCRCCRFFILFNLRCNCKDNKTSQRKFVRLDYLLCL